MLNLENGEHRVFAVEIYNEVVREMVTRMQHHASLSDRWAKAQHRDVVARDESEARTLIAERFPPQDGFVIARVKEAAY